MIIASAFKISAQQRNTTASDLMTGSSIFPSFFGAISGNTAVNHNSALSIAAFYNGVDQISNDLAKLPFQVIARTDNGRMRDRNHPVDKLISTAPSHLMTSFTLRKMLVQSALVKGDGFAMILRNLSGVPVQLRYVDYDKLLKVFVYEDQLWYHIKGLDLPVPGSDMIHIMGYSDNGLRGMSVIKHAAASMGITLNAQDFAAKSYDNKAISTGVLETDKNIDSSSKPKVASAFASAMNQPTTYRTAVLDEGMKYKRISLTPAELQFVETQKNGVVEIARWLNIAPQKLKDMTNASYSSLEFIDIQHHQDCIRPWQIKFEQEFNRKLFTPSEQATYYTSFKTNALLSTDAKGRAEYYSKAIFSGFLTRNEVREFEDMNTLDGLDQPLTPVNAQTQEQIEAKLTQILNDGQ